MRLAVTIASMVVAGLGIMGLFTGLGIHAQEAKAQADQQYTLSVVPHGRLFIEKPDAPTNLNSHLKSGDAVLLQYSLDPNASGKVSVVLHESAPAGLEVLGVFKGESVVAPVGSDFQVKAAVKYFSVMVKALRKGAYGMEVKVQGRHPVPLAFWIDE